MVTNHISGSQRAIERIERAAAAQSAGEEGAAEKFAAVLRQLLGGGSAAAMQQQVSGVTEIPETPAAPVKPREEEPEAKHAAKGEETSVKSDREDDQTRDEEDDAKQVKSDSNGEAAPVVQAVQQSAPQQVNEVDEAVVESTDASAAQPDAGAGVEQDAPMVAADETAVAETVSGAPTEVASQKVAAASANSTDPSTEGAQSGMTNQGSDPAAAQQSQTATASPRDASKVRERTPSDHYAALSEVDQAEEQQVPAVELFAPPAAAVAAPAVTKDAEGAARTASAIGAAMNNAASEEPGSAGAPAVRSLSAVSGTETAGMMSNNAAEKSVLMRTKGAQGGTPAGKSQEKILRQVQDLLKRAAQTRDGNSVSVRVDPPELGMVTVKVTQRDSQIYARIIPDSPEVEHVLRTRVQEVTQVLIAAGLKAEQVHIAIGRERSAGETFSVPGYSTGNGQTGNSGQQSGQQSNGSGERSSLRGTLGGSAGSNGNTRMDTPSALEAGWVA